MSKQNKTITESARAVSYMLNNKRVTRGVGLFKDRQSIGQLAVREATRISTAFLKTVKDFIEITFEPAAALKKDNAWNIASSRIRKEAIRGLYPEQQIDFSSLCLSQGDLPPVDNLELKVEKDRLEYSWNPGNTRNGMLWNDKVMLLVYFPEIKKAEFILSGANRNEGKQIFIPLKFAIPRVIETYLTFISSNHKTVSDSVYTGRLIW